MGSSSESQIVPLQTTPAYVCDSGRALPQRRWYSNTRRGSPYGYPPLADPATTPTSQCRKAHQSSGSSVYNTDQQSTFNLYLAMSSPTLGPGLNLVAASFPNLISSYPRASWWWWRQACKYGVGWFHHAGKLEELLLRDVVGFNCLLNLCSRVGSNLIGQLLS
ncbi:hypothetical protein L1987_10449 [Smallanthus sonchifolius]|uniref:Uncharacterized protein n=1 Tax=Smallanthus sonchifolius TaxID=185202 RepID=A0ACB9JS90_9ASTR|nr:hypothetical protein L1987_10449 [Smallanthus sonchifolius]